MENKEHFLEKYNDELLDSHTFETYSIKLKRAFNSLNEDFFKILWERVSEHRFTKQRFIDAIKYIIDNSKFAPVVSQVISFNKTERVYTHHQMCELVKEGYHWDDFSKIQIKGKCFFKKLKF